jgi:hypothetical protein
MTFKRTLLPLCILMVLAGGLTSMAIYCQEKPPMDDEHDPILARLQDFRFVGVHNNDRQALVICPMTDEQKNAYAEAVAKSSDFYRQRVAKQREAEAKRGNAEDKPKAPRNRFEIEERWVPEAPFIETYGFQQFGTVCRLVCIGNDYIEVESSLTPGATELIPVSVIARVEFRKELPTCIIRGVDTEPPVDLPAQKEE